jgi:hypothetical protein
MARSKLSGDRSVRYHDIIYIIRGIRPFAKESGRSQFARHDQPASPMSSRGTQTAPSRKPWLHEPALSSGPIISDHFWVGSSPRRKPNSDQVARSIIPPNRSGLASGAEECGERVGKGRQALTNTSRSSCVISSYVGSGCASGASCAQPCGVLYLVYDWPCVLLWGSMTKQCTESQTSIPYRLGAKTQILYGKALLAQGLGDRDSGGDGLLPKISNRLPIDEKAPEPVLASLCVRNLALRQLGKAAGRGPSPAG